MSMADRPFQPIRNRTRSAATVAGAVDITGFGADGAQLLIVNAGTQLVNVRLTRSGETDVASAQDMPILPNTSRMISRSETPGPVSDQFTRLSVFAGAAGSTVYVTPGDGEGQT